MDIVGDEKFLSTVGIVLQDLQCFITQKNNQNIIYALLQIRKAARKNQSSQINSIDRKSNASQSQKNYSSRKSSLSAHSVGRSVDKQSHASFDIIKGAQKFNETRRKGIQQKLHTQGFQPDKQFSSKNRQQKTRFSNQHNSPHQNTEKPAMIVPKLVGLVSSEQISDIQQPFGVDSRDNKRTQYRQYQQSIAEVDDDDDQFQDIVLSRLDKIQQKVNQMLRDKRHQRLSTLADKAPHSQPYHISKSKLQNVGSGPNIIYSRQVNDTEFYQYPQSRYPNSTTLMSPRVYTFHNSKNTSQNPSSKKIVTKSFKQNLTDRMVNVSKIANELNYYTDHEQYPQNQNSKQFNNQICEDEINEHSEVINKNKTLGHYRQSEKTLEQPDNQQNSRHVIRVQKGIQTIIDFSKIKQQTLDDKAFKYIPLSKMNQTKTNNVPQKTQRQISRRNQEFRQINSKNIPNYINKTQAVLIEKTDRKYQTSSQDHLPQQYQKFQVGDYNYRKNIRKNDFRYRSGKNSGVRQNQLGGSGVKVYTQQGDSVVGGDDLSVSSDKNIYSQIRQLRQITKLYGAERQKKQQSYAQNQNIKKNLNQSKNLSQYANQDYRYHQKTQRPKYSSNKNNFQEKNQYVQEQHVVIQGRYPEQRLIKVIKQIPHYPPQIQRVNQSRIPQQTQYIQYNPNEPIIYSRSNDNNSYNPVYVVRQQQQPIYQQVRQVYQDPRYRVPSSSQFQTVIMHDDGHSQSHRKYSSGSINSFKSIPYVRVQGNPSITKQRSVQYITQRPVQYVQRSAYNQY